MGLVPVDHKCPLLLGCAIIALRPYPNAAAKSLCYRAAPMEPSPNAAAKALYAAIAQHPCASHFRVLPDPVLFSDYYAIVKKPVCLSDMHRAMSSDRYTLGDMQRDIRRMIANAKKYNKPEAVVYQDSLELERVTRRLVKEIERDGPEDEDEDTL